MIRTNPTTLSLTVEDVNNLVVPRFRGASANEAEVLTDNPSDKQSGKKTDKQQRIFGRVEEQVPPHDPSHQPLLSPVAASTKDGSANSSPSAAANADGDSFMEDVSLPTPALATTHSRDDNNVNSQTAGNDGTERGFGHNHADVEMTPPHQQHTRGFASEPGSDTTMSPRWLSLPPRRPHPAWAAAEREIATSPLAHRVPR